MTGLRREIVGLRKGAGRMVLKGDDPRGCDPVTGLRRDWSGAIMGEELGLLLM